MKGKVKLLLNQWVFITSKEIPTSWSDKSLSSSRKEQETYKINKLSYPLCKEGIEFEGDLVSNEINLTILDIKGKCTNINSFNRSGIPLSKELADMIESGKFGDFQKSITYDYIRK